MRTRHPDTVFAYNVLLVAQLMLVEDDARVRRALIRALTDYGHVVTTTSGAMSALQQIHQAPPDLVLLDLGLPDIGGYEALQMIRAISAVPVVVPPGSSAEFGMFVVPATRLQKQSRQPRLPPSFWVGKS